jgi:hypothetical protein
MNNEHDDDKRPFSERMKDDSYKLPPEAGKLADHLRENERMQRLAAATAPPPTKKLGSGLIDHSQNMTAAAIQIAEK